MCSFPAFTLILISISTRKGAEGGGRTTKNLPQCHRFWDQAAPFQVLPVNWWRKDVARWKRGPNKTVCGKCDSITLGHALLHVPLIPPQTHRSLPVSTGIIGSDSPAQLVILAITCGLKKSHILEQTGLRKQSSSCGECFILVVGVQYLLTMFFSVRKSDRAGNEDGGSWCQGDLVPARAF